MTNGLWSHQLEIAGTACVLFWPILWVVLWYFPRFISLFDVFTQKEKLRI